MPATKPKDAGDAPGEIMISDIANAKDPFALLRKINPLLESEVDAPARMGAALHFLSESLLQGASVMEDEARDGLGYLLLTIAESMSLHAKIVVHKKQTKPRLSEVQR